MVYNILSNQVNKDMMNAPIEVGSFVEFDRTLVISDCSMRFVRIKAKFQEIFEDGFAVTILPINETEYTVFAKEVFV